MKRGCFASSARAARNSLIVDFRTDSLTCWWPQTSSSSADLVTSMPRCLASAHKTPNALGASATGCPARVSLASPSFSSNASNCSRRESVWGMDPMDSKTCHQPLLPEVSMDGIRYGGDIRQWRQLTMATNGQARGRSKADQWREAPIANAPIATAASANDPIVYIPTVFAPTSFLRRAARTVGTNAGLGLLRCHSSMFNEPPNQCTDRGTNNNADCENR